MEILKSSSLWYQKHLFFSENKTQNEITFLTINVVSQVMNTMSKFHSLNLIEKSAKIQKQHFVILYQYLFLGDFLRKIFIDQPIKALTFCE